MRGTILPCLQEEQFPGRGPEISRRLVWSRPNICQPWSHHKAQLNKTSLGSLFYIGKQGQIPKIPENYLWIFPTQ